MFGFESANENILIGVSYLPRRKKPCLIIRKGNTITKYASFNDDQAAKEFMDILANFMGFPRIDWNIEDI